MDPWDGLSDSELLAACDADSPSASTSSTGSSPSDGAFSKECQLDSNKHSQAKTESEELPGIYCKGQDGKLQYFPVDTKEANILKRKGYLSVSNLVSQAWCELKLMYSMTLPVTVVETPAIKTGKVIHHDREVAVQDSVPVAVRKPEDAAAVKLINMYGGAADLLAGAPIRREIPVYGRPLGLGVFVMGIIDEIRLDQETFTLDIVELKTRVSKFMPAKMKRQTHELQAMLYKVMFDDIVRGRFTKADMEEYFEMRGYDMKEPFGDDIVSKISQLSLKENNLDCLTSAVFDRLSVLPCASQLFIEYCHQESREMIGITEVNFREDWLKEKMKQHVSLWTTERKPLGVDIEDAWKCGTCEFAAVCEWRKEKVKECVRRNSSKRKK